jgi:hypothetical protein
MRIPGFEAEASLLSENSSKKRRLKQSYCLADVSVQPQAIPECFEICDEICAGDIIGDCMPSCLCVCHGGKKCGIFT